MKFFWSFLSRIYSNLQQEGLQIPKPKILFHQPKKKLQCEYQCIIFADTTFTNSERVLILEALDDLHYFCNGLIQLEIVFTLDPKDSETIKNNCVFLRATTDHPSIVRADGYHEALILGLCEYMDNDTMRLYVVPDRLHSKLIFKTTAIHELGHFVGMGHTPMPSIMHKSCSNVLYPTKIDAKEFSRVQNVYYRDLRFFKL